MSGAPIEHEAPNFLSSLRRAMGRPTSYYDGRVLVYVAVGDEHFTTDEAWFEYIQRRREVPHKVTLYGTLREMRERLLKERSVVI